jgi:tRNA(fMet)-specific endonuclease VapC
MSGDEIALDTNQAIAVLNGAGDAAQWILAFTKVHLPVPVVGELRFGALNSPRATQNLRRVEQLVARCHPLNITLGTAEVYARVRLQLKQKGKPIPENDIWIAAVCIERDLSLATSDSHFQEIVGLKIIER